MTIPATDEYAHMRAAFRHVTLGLMAWAPPPEPPWSTEPRSSSGGRETLYGTAEYVDPYDVDQDWEKRA